MIRMNTEDIKRQLDLGEDSYWEFKQVRVPRRPSDRTQTRRLGR